MVGLGKWMKSWPWMFLFCPRLYHKRKIYLDVRPIEMDDRFYLKRNLLSRHLYIQLYNILTFVQNTSRESHVMATRATPNLKLPDGDYRSVRRPGPVYESCTPTRSESDATASLHPNIRLRTRMREKWQQRPLVLPSSVDLFACLISSPN
jgi:hypothetical protein